jgi:hypothetical protein
VRLKQFAVTLFFLCFGRYSVMVFFLFKRVLKIPRERGGRKRNSVAKCKGRGAVGNGVFSRRQEAASKS